MSDWSKYAITSLGGIAHDRTEMKQVAHVAHTETAFRILKDGKIRSGLVFDKSKLNTERILVTWVSPNIWNKGSRYGTVEFWFPFKEIIRDKNYYWVEAMEEYSPTACRFLITSEDYSKTLTKYDPSIPGGPWWYKKKDDTHNRQPDYTLEFMYEGNLKLQLCNELDFIDHHALFCSIDHNTCTEKALEARKAQDKVVAKILIEDYKDIEHLLLKETKSKVIVPTGIIIDALNSYLVKSSKITYTGTVKGDSDISLSLIRSSLYSLSDNKRNDFDSIASLFESEEEFKSTLLSYVTNKLKLKNVKLLRDQLEK